MSNIERRLNELIRSGDSKKLAQVAHTELVKLTPIKSGNARRKTKLVGDQVIADYPYAQRLDENWSKQTKNKGLIEPTLEAVQKYIDKL